MPKSNSVNLIDDRQYFSLVYHELWDCYLPQIGPAATLLYCYLLRLVRHGLSGPGGSGWQAEVCAPLGMSLNDSHQAWARLQEYGLILANSDGSYSLTQPRSKDDFQATFKDFVPLQQPLAPVSSQPSTAGEATMRALRKNRGQKSLFSVVEQEFGRALSMTEMEKVLSLEKSYPRELVEVATELAVIAQARNLAYIEQILVNWQLKGITTAQAARQDSEQHRASKAKRRSNPKTTGKAGQPEAENPWDDIRFYTGHLPKED